MLHFSFFARWKVLRVRRRVRIIRKMRNAEPLGQRGQAGMLEWNELLLTQPFWLDSGSQVWRKQQKIKNVRIAKADIYIYTYIGIHCFYRQISCFVQMFSTSQFAEDSLPSLSKLGRPWENRNLFWLVGFNMFQPPKVLVSFKPPISRSEVGVNCYHKLAGICLYIYISVNTYIYNIYIYNIYIYIYIYIYVEIPLTRTEPAEWLTDT